MPANWDDLRVFLAVARKGSISAAGTQLKMDPATVGRRISRLEEALGAPLFAKSPQGYALSEAGEILHPKAGEVEQAMLTAEDMVRGQEDKLTGTVRIGAPDGCANFLLPQVIASIVDAHPELEIQIVALPRVFNLTRREADMAITVSEPAGARLSVEKISNYHLYLGAARSYLKGRKIKKLSHLKGHRMVGYIPDMIYDKELDYLSELGVQRVGLASNSVMVQFNWIQHGAGLGIVHGFALPASPRIEKVLANKFSLKRAFYMVRPTEDLKVRRLNRVAELLKDGLRQEVARLEGEA